ncbi:MAG: hypothetical protein IPH16_04925 [Haliscomenobacter sp.]|nr:hypothetical protein [Haliscomenobacter sp.]MBK7474919.1 hypothetical protein [Haliscomenobacter sp.]MBK8880493.1 hypothetical protein [Haliscomenobacter sp.]
MIRNIQILFYAMLAGQALFAAVAYFFLPANKSAALADSGLFFYLPFIFMISMGGAAWVLNDALKRKAPGRDKPMEDRLRHYQQRVMLRLALIESAVLMAIIFGFVSANTQLYLLAALGLGLFLYFRPGVAEFVTDYQVSASEEREL